MATSDPEEKSLLKTLWEKEKMLVTSIFSFPHNVFYHIKEKLHHLSHNEIVVEFVQGQNFVVW